MDKWTQSEVDELAAACPRYDDHFMYVPGTARVLLVKNECEIVRRQEAYDRTSGIK